MSSSAQQPDPLLLYWEIFIPVCILLLKPECFFGSTIRHDDIDKKRNDLIRRFILFKWVCQQIFMFMTTNASLIPFRIVYRPNPNSSLPFLGVYRPSGGIQNSPSQRRSTFLHVGPLWSTEVQIKRKLMTFFCWCFEYLSSGSYASC